MKQNVSISQAKAQLPRLLRGVQAGKRYTITRRGEAVADLIPAEGNRHHESAEAVEQMKRFMVKAPVMGGNSRKFIEDGRA
jgi:prevent-host-death family protein